MITEAKMRRDFAAYYLDLKKEQGREGGAVPSKKEEWSRFVSHLVDEGDAPVEALNWKCPRSLEAEMRN